MTVHDRIDTIASRKGEMVGPAALVRAQVLATYFSNGMFHSV